MAPLRIALVFLILTIAPLISEFLLVVPQPDVFCYRLNGMGAQKVLVTLFSYIFHVKAKRNIVYEYLKTKNLSRDTNIIPQMH